MKPFHKTLSFYLVFIGLLSFSSAEARKTSSRKTIPLTFANLAQIQYPFNAAILQEVWTPTESIAPEKQKIVLYIQDAHCHFEAQTNIAKLLEKLIRAYDLALVAVEGTEGLIDTTPLAEFKDEEVKEMVVKYFMRRGKITGPEYLSIMKKSSFTLFGIEESRLYDANLNAFKKILPFREKSQGLCQTLETALDQLKNAIFSPALKTLDSHIEKFAAGELPLFQYGQFLEDLIHSEELKAKPISLQKSCPNLFHLLNAFRYEKTLNTGKLEQEQEQLLKNLSATLSKDKLSKLIATSLQVRLGKVGQTRYYLILDEVLTENLKSMPSLSRWKTTFPEVWKYIQYAKTYEGINQKKAFQEIDNLAHVILENLFLNEDERTLFYLSKHIELLQKLFLLELPRKDLLYFRKHREDFKIARFINFIEAKSKTHKINGLEEIQTEKLKELEALQDDALNFYKLASRRDKTLLNNTLKTMKQFDTNVTILITGGYHMEGIKKQLRNRGIAYAILFPKITKDQPDNPYIEVLSQQKSAFEEFIHRVEELD